MTRKAHNVDKQRTKEAGFLDKRSYWTNSGHEYLFGDDARAARSRTFFHSAGMCQGCDIPHYIGLRGHMDHINGGNTDDRCWCKHNLRWVCPEFHRLKHVHVMSGKVGK